MGSRDAKHGHEHVAHRLDHHPAMAGNLSLNPTEISSHGVVTLKGMLQPGCGRSLDLTHQHRDQLALRRGRTGARRIRYVHGQPLQPTIGHHETQTILGRIRPRPHRQPTRWPQPHQLFRR